MSFRKWKYDESYPDINVPDNRKGCTLKDYKVFRRKIQKSFRYFRRWKCNIRSGFWLDYGYWNVEPNCQLEIFIRAFEEWNEVRGIRNVIKYRRKHD